MGEETPSCSMKMILNDVMRKNILESGRVLLAGEIDYDVAELATTEILYAGLVQKAPNRHCDHKLHVILNSVGGDVYAGLLIYNTILEVATWGVSTVVEARGLAASMGTIILQAGQKRIAPVSTRILIHEVAEMPADNFGVTKWEDEAGELRAVNDMLVDILARRTGKKKATINKLISRKDVWYSAQEALKFGLIDEVI